MARLAPAAAALAAAIALTSPARADDLAYGVDTQLTVQAIAGFVQTNAQNSGLVQATAPVSYTLTANASGGGASASATGSATSFYGFLELSGSGFANPGGGNGAGANDTAVVGGFPNDYFRDQILVRSDSLAPGTLVSIGFSIDYTGSANAVSESPGNAISKARISSLFQLTDLASAQTIFQVTHGEGTFHDTLTAIVPVGDPLRLEGQLSGFGSANSGDAGGPSSFAFSDPTTLHFDAITPGLDVVTASGHDYSLTAGVPEPAAWALLLVGFGGTGAALRSRRRLTLSLR